MTITTTSPRTGTRSDTTLQETGSAAIDGIATAAAAAFDILGDAPREARAVLLEAMADHAEAARPDLVTVADRETALGTDRLHGELTRSINQFRLFADVVRDGAYLEAAIDHAADTPLGPMPDVRRMLVPLGPVVVYGSSNFPFAFSVLGGDTASAVAAGCPVLLKAHGSHPLTCDLSYEVLRAAAAAAGAPAATFGIVYGQDAGIELVRHPEVTAVSLTGSLTAARAIQAAIDTRAEPIPFFGELSSLNPVVVTPAAAHARPGELADGLGVSALGSAGQLCTKPGIALVPAGADGDQIVDALAARFSDQSPAVMLNPRIRDSFTEIRDRLVTAGATLRASGGDAHDASFSVAATLLTVAAAGFTPAMAEECFGPLLVVVRYHDRAEALAVLGLVPGSLTATVHAEPDDPDLRPLLRRLARRAGRLIVNGYPTGVRVSWAQHHGGPWPSTNSQHTSVGATAIRRWLRPVAWQNTPPAHLPEELRDGDSTIARRVDGRLIPPR